MTITWQQLGECWRTYYSTGGEELFFSPDIPGGAKGGAAGEKARVFKAKQMCARCVVRAECLDFAIDNDCVGIWGGMDTGERRKYARQRNNRFAS